MYLLAVCGTDEMVGLLSSMVGSAALTMVLLLALFYMAAQFFRKPEYEAFVSIEIYQVVISLVIFGAVFLSSCFAEGLVKSFIGNGQDAFQVAHGYLQYMSNDVAFSAVKKLQALAILSQWASSITMRFGASVWGVIIPAFPSFTVVERMVEFLLMMVTPFTASLMVQQIGLQVIQGVMFPFVLPMGVVLRMFPPTRDAGAFFISTALAFGLVFPFTYYMHKTIVQDTRIPKTLLAGNPNLQSFRADYPKLYSFIGESGLFDPQSMLFHPLYMLSFMLLQAIFLPALSISLTVAFIKGFNKFITQKFG